MIIKPSSTKKERAAKKPTLRRGGFKQLSDYLQGQSGNENENEAVNVIASNTGLTDINDFCILGNRLAAPKRSGKNPLKNPIEHISIRTREGEILTPEMILSKLPKLLKALTDEKGCSYASCPWMLVQHMKKQKGNGRVEPHYHLAIVRVDDKGRIPNPRTAKICFDMAQKIARELGFKPAFDQANGSRYTQRQDRLAGLWAETESLPPAARLKKFERAGFIAAKHDNRPEVVFIDRYGKPHSLHRIPALREKGLKQAEITAAFGLSTEKLAALPTVAQATKTVKRKAYVRRISRRFTNPILRALGGLGRIYSNALPTMRGGDGVGNQGAVSLEVFAVLWGLSRSPQRGELQPIRAEGGLKNHPPPKHSPRRVKASRGWWVEARAEAVFYAMLAAGFSSLDAQKAVNRIWEEEAQRQAEEQRYLDSLSGWTPKRGSRGRDRQQPHNRNH